MFFHLLHSEIKTSRAPKQVATFFLFWDMLDHNHMRTQCIGKFNAHMT
jgi:hypothetical protein